MRIRLVALWVGSCLCLGCPGPAPSPADPSTADAACPFTEADWALVEGPDAGFSVARRWDEMTLAAIRRDLPQPTVHARNLFHVSAAMYDAWATYDPTSDGVYFTNKNNAADVPAARREAITYAAYRVLEHRYRRSAGAPVVLTCLADEVRRLGYDPADTDADGGTARAVGNDIARTVIAACADDGANEANAYADTTGWVAANQPLFVTAPGTIMANPDLWQPLSLAQAFTQNGIAQDGGVQPYVGAHWKNVTPFAMSRTKPDALYHDAGTPPHTLSADVRAWAVEVIRKQSQLGLTSDTIDISPGALGNNSLGANDGSGHAVNPVTHAPYAPNVVPVADFGRVLAEFWADGPKSETPPGHWNVLANDVADAPGFERRWSGQGPSLDPLEWDVKVYLALNGALHDAAITAWEVKRVYTSARPISIIRYLAGLGQSSDPSAASYNENGLPLVPGLIELITDESSAPGQRHEALAAYKGEVALRRWRGEGLGGVAWARTATWFPYQRATFVTPAFPGYVSGHSTFSRAAAEVLTALTGSAFFPQGLNEYRITSLGFESGPSVPVTLQWATYFDAADQAGQSRLWGGIHLQPDDFVGRRLGHQVGLDAVERANGFYAGTARP